MDCENTSDGGTGQATLSESWGDRDPNPQNQNTEEQKTETQESQGVTISQGPNSVVNSDGVVLPFTRTQTDQHETATDSNEPDTSEGTISTADVTATDQRDSDDGGRVKVRAHPEETREDHSETESERAPMKPISTHAKRAGSNTDETETDNSPEQTRHSKPGTQGIPTANTIVHENCPECDGETVREGSDQYCPDCGLLHADQNIDPGPEWRAFDSNQKTSRSRVGGPVKDNIHDKGLSTVIGNDKTDAYGKPLSISKQKQMTRLRKWDSRFKVKNTKERNLRQAFGEIQRIGSEMDLPEYVEETACTVYRRALNEELLPGRSIEAMASASAYIAIRQAGIPKTLDHLSDFCRVDESRVTGAYSYLGRELGIEIEPPEVLEYLGRIASELEVSKQTERVAGELLEASVKKKLHSGKAPSGMAAAAVYAATMITRMDRITQADASEAGDVCELTIRTRHRELLEAYGIDYEEVSPPSQSEADEKQLEMEDGNRNIHSDEGDSPTISAD